MNIEDQLTVALSQEELFVILAHLNLSGLMGLDGSIFDNLTESQTQLVLVVAERALIARGFLRPGNSGGLELLPTILLLMNICIEPTNSLVVTRNYPKNTSIAYFFHTKDGITVAHTCPASGIHQFVVLKGQTDFIDSVLRILDLQDSPTIDCLPGKIEESVMVRANQVADAQGLSGVLSVLKQSSLNTEATHELAVTFTQPIANTTIVCINHKKSADSSAEGFTILQGSNGLWMLKPIEGVNTTGNMIEIAPASSQNVVSAVKTLICV